MAVHVGSYSIVVLASLLPHLDKFVLKFEFMLACKLLSSVMGDCPKAVGQSESRFPFLVGLVAYDGLETIQGFGEALDFASDTVRHVPEWM